MSPTFKKSYLHLKDPGGVCHTNGYQYVLDDLANQLKQSKSGQPLDKSSYFKSTPEPDSCLEMLYKKRYRKKSAQWFISHLAGHDGNYKSISNFDVEYAYYHLYGKQWKETWFENYSPSFSGTELQIKFRNYGAILKDDHGSKILKKRVKEYLTALETYLKTNGTGYQKKKYLPTIQLFLTNQEPALAVKLLGSSLSDFIVSSEKEKESALKKIATAPFPDVKAVAELMPYLTGPEALILRKTLFKSDVLKAMELFENKLIADQGYGTMPTETKSYESEIFPNLPVNTPFKKRQKAIDQFLGKPTYFRYRNHVADNKTIGWTTLKKYVWVGNTEVFSLESGKPGPTTLVFSPHYHEDNPRKYFHWLKDIPLTSGRVIFIPEANRAMGLTKRATNPMNGIFNEALTSDRMDYLIVRRVEYLMGLVDGVIGIHDAYEGPFYISDTISSPTSLSNNIQGPNASPWIPKDVLKITKLKPSMEKFRRGSVYHSKIPPLQIQWKVAECSRRLLKKLTGNNYRFSPDTIAHGDAGSVDSTTGYMNYVLKKPAMTFEGKKGEEHGQLHAMAVTTLLIAFGHKIHSSYKKELENKNPTVDKKIYVGLPPNPPKPKDTPEAEEAKTPKTTGEESTDNP